MKLHIPKIPTEINGFHDDRFGPLISLWPRKFKIGKCRRPAAVYGVSWCGEAERGGRKIHLLRTGSDVELSSPKNGFMFYLGIGHFERNPYRQRSPYVFWYDDKFWCRIMVPDRRCWRRRTYVTWMPKIPRNTGGPFNLSEHMEDRKYYWAGSPLNPVFFGLYEIEVAQKARQSTSKRFDMCLKSLTNYRDGNAW